MALYYLAKENIWKRTLKIRGNDYLELMNCIRSMLGNTRCLNFQTYQMGRGTTQRAFKISCRIQQFSTKLSFRN